MQQIWKLLFVMIIAVTGAMALVWLLSERDSSYMAYQTTWAGRPAYGQLDRNGWYTFYYPDRNAIGELTPIATFPAAEAAKLH